MSPRTAIHSVPLGPQRCAGVEQDDVDPPVERGDGVSEVWRLAAGEALVVAVDGSSGIAEASIKDGLIRRRVCRRRTRIEVPDEDHRSSRVGWSAG